MLTYMGRRYADGQAGARAVLSSSSIFCSPSLTRTACQPMNPPSLAASAARWAHSSSHSEKAWVSSGVAFVATMPRTRESSSRICLPARPAESGLKPLTGFWCRSAIALTSWATSPTRSPRPSWIVVPTTLTTAPVSLTTSMGPPGSASVIAMPATRGARTMADHSSSLNSAFPVMSRRYQPVGQQAGAALPSAFASVQERKDPDFAGRQLDDGSPARSDGRYRDAGAARAHGRGAAGCRDADEGVAARDVAVAGP